MSNFLPFGTNWPMNDRLEDRAAVQYRSFQDWVSGLRLCAGQERVISELLSMMSATEFVEGRAACVTSTDALAQRTGLGESLGGVLADLVNAELLTKHSAAEVFGDNRPGVVLRVRKPGVVLSVEAAGLLWMPDAWTAMRAA